MHVAINKKKKILFFVSTGRCGTKRIAQILKDHLPSDQFSVKHQMGISRIANVLGNIMFYIGESEWIKHKLYNYILDRYAKEKHFICSDPLVSMILPADVINNPNTYIIHLIRDKYEFAESFFRFTRNRFLSFFAHNFIPFWQIGIWPIENIINPNIKKKYKKVWIKKNRWLETNYKKNPNYQQVDMSSIFSFKYIDNIINNIYKLNIEIDPYLLSIKTNKSIKI